MSFLCNINMGFVCIAFRWRFSCIISSVIQLDYVVGIYAKLFLRCFQPALFCTISPASFSSGRID